MVDDLADDLERSPFGTTWIGSRQAADEVDPLAQGQARFGAGELRAHRRNRGRHGIKLFEGGGIRPCRLDQPSR